MATGRSSFFFTVLTASWLAIAIAWGTSSAASADTPTSAQQDEYTYFTQAVNNAAMNDDSDAIHALMTPECAKWDSSDLLETVFRPIRDVGQATDFDCFYTSGDCGTTMVKAAKGEYYMSIRVSPDNRISALVHHGYKDGDSVILPEPTEAYVSVANAFAFAVNSNDAGAIESMFTPEMQRSMPLDKVKRLVDETRTEVGQIQNVTFGCVVVDIATFTLTGEKGAKNLNICLDANQHLAFMTLHNASLWDQTADNRPPDEYVKTVSKLADAVNQSDRDATASLFAANVTDQMPPDAIADYFAKIHASCGDFGKVELDSYYGDQTDIMIDAQKTRLLMKLSVDKFSKITWFDLSVSQSATAGGSNSIVLPKLDLKKPGG